MDAYDVVVVGGGPAGSTCAWALRRAGLDVVVIDRAVFPRDKVCGGWITPQVVADLHLDADEYRRGRTFQPITGFRTGIIGGPSDVETSYGGVVSFGIRRCEFDDYLLRRSGACLKLGAPAVNVRRGGAGWVVNDAVTAPILVGAGGHFCPVARQLNADLDRVALAALVVAQEVEFPLTSDEETVCTTEPRVPELYFCRDLKGYGWCFRKGHYVNIGLGRTDRHALPRMTAEFVEFLARRGKIRRSIRRWHGHAYLLHDVAGRRIVDDGVLLVGDAAGLAYPRSGEGIRPAVESALLAARAIVRAGGRRDRDSLAAYETWLHDRLDGDAQVPAFWRFVPSQLLMPLGRALLRVPAFVRHVALNRWFLHLEEPP